MVGSCHRNILVIFSFVSALGQMVMQRLQKERDNFQEEMEKLHERIEFQQNQIAKAQRDRENVLSELDLVKERWEKAHSSHQKLTVSSRKISEGRSW